MSYQNQQIFIFKKLEPDKLIHQVIKLLISSLKRKQSHENLTISVSRNCPFKRILNDPSQQPVVMATMPNLKGLLGDSGRPLFILPQRVKLCKGGQKGQKTQSTEKKEKRKRGKKFLCVCVCVHLWILHQLCWTWTSAWWLFSFLHWHWPPTQLLLLLWGFPRSAICQTRLVSRRPSPLFVLQRNNRNKTTSYNRDRQGNSIVDT